MTNVTIGLLKVSKGNFGTDASNRMNEFAMSVTQANAALKAQQGSKGGIRVLVAPEYYWSGYGEIGQFVKQTGPLAMDRSDKHDLYKGLKKVSSNAGSLVLVAGSIFYKKPGSNGVEGYNVCPVLRNGNFLLKAYKDFDDGSISKGVKNATHQTKDSEPYFKVDKVSFGLEVCGDHNDQGGKGGKLKQWNANAGKTIDIQILVSDSNMPQASSVCAKTSGYLVHCDIGGTDSGIRAYPAGGPYDASSAISASSITGAQINGASVHSFNFNV